MTNKPNGVIYIGVTDNLQERVKEHKFKMYPNSFTAKYNCDKLVYFEKLDNGVLKPQDVRNNSKNGRELGKFL